MSSASAVLDRPTETPSQAEPARDAWHDNAKFVLIVLVAVGHLLSKGVTERMGVAHALYVWIYLFHMPAFIFIAGHFSRRRSLTERSVQGIVMRAIVPFIVFTVLYATAASLVTGNALRIDLVNPYWLLWFLPALAAWKLITPVYLNLRWPLAISLVVGLGVGLIERVGADFSISRIFSLAPFFVLGAMITPESLRRLTQPLARMAGAAVLLVSATLVFLFHDHIARPGYLFWNNGYDKQHLTALEGFASRGAMYVLGAVLLLALLAVMPTRRTWIAGLGAASLYIYLLHGFLVRGASKFGLVDLVTDVPGLIAMLVVTTAVCIALGSPWVRKLARPVVEPKLKWLLRRDDDEDPAPSGAGRDRSWEDRGHGGRERASSGSR